MNEYQRLLEAVDKLPKEAVESAPKEKTRKGYDTTGYQYQYLVNVMNEVFGLEGWGFDYKVLKEIEGTYARSGGNYWEITVDISLWTLADGKTAKRTCVGGHRSEMHPDALKGAITNGLKKTLALLGVGKKAYEGTLDEDYRPIPGGNADRTEANKQAKAEAVASQAKLNKEAGRLQVASPPTEPTAEEIQREGREVFESAWAEARQPLAELKHTEPKPSIPLCPVLPPKPLEALRKEMDSLVEIQGISRGAFISACVGVFKRVLGDWDVSEWGKAVQYLKDMADGKVSLETSGGQGSFKRFEEPQETDPGPVPGFNVPICKEIWMACVGKARRVDGTPEEVLKTASIFPTDEGKEKFLTFNDLVRATKESKWFKNTLRKLDIPEKEIPF